MPGMVDLRLLRTLVEVQRTGSITGAAVVLGLSQPAVTSQVKALEQRLGRPLFVRQARGVVATPLAEMLAAEAAPHVDALQQLVAGGLNERDPIAGQTVNIGGPAELITLRVVPCLAPLIAQGLRVRSVLGLPDELLAALTTGRLDLAVSTVRVRRRGLSAGPLCDEELILVASPAGAQRLRHRLATSPASEVPAAGAAVKIAAGVLAEAPLIAYAEDMPLLRRYWSRVFDSVPPGRPAVVVPDLRGVLNAVAAGLGISVLPRYLCQSALDSGEIEPILEPDVAPINTIYLLARAGSLAERHIATVHRHLLQQGKRW